MLIQIAFDRFAFAGRQLAVDISKQIGFWHLFLHVAHLTVLNLGSSCVPVKTRSAVRARLSRDIRVPAGISSMPAASW
jgi:hypothetical protein